MYFLGAITHLIILYNVIGVTTQSSPVETTTELLTEHILPKPITDQRDFEPEKQHMQNIWGSKKSQTLLNNIQISTILDHTKIILFGKLTSAEPDKNTDTDGTDYFNYVDEAMTKSEVYRSGIKDGISKLTSPIRRQMLLPRYTVHPLSEIPQIQAVTSVKPLTKFPQVIFTWSPVRYRYRQNRDDYFQRLKEKWEWDEWYRTRSATEILPVIEEISEAYFLEVNKPSIPVHTEIAEQNMDPTSENAELTNVNWPWAKWQPLIETEKPINENKDSQRNLSESNYRSLIGKHREGVNQDWRKWYLTSAVEKSPQELERMKSPDLGFIESQESIYPAQIETSQRPMLWFTENFKNKIKEEGYQRDTVKLVPQAMKINPKVELLVPPQDSVLKAQTYTPLMEMSGFDDYLADAKQKLDEWYYSHFNKTIPKKVVVKVEYEFTVPKNPIISRETKTPRIYLPRFEKYRKEKKRKEWLHTSTKSQEEETEPVSESLITQELLLLTQSETPKMALPWYDEVISKRDEWHRTKTISNEEKIIPESELTIMQESLSPTQTEVAQVHLPWYKDVKSKWKDWRKTKPTPKEDEIKFESEMPITQNSPYPTQIETSQIHLPWYEDIISKWKEWRITTTLSRKEKIKPESELLITQAILSVTPTKTTKDLLPWYENVKSNWEKWQRTKTTSKEYKIKPSELPITQQSISWTKTSQMHLPWYEDIISNWGKWRRTTTINKNYSKEKVKPESILPITEKTPSQAHFPWYGDLMSKWAEWHGTKITPKENKIKLETTSPITEKTLFPKQTESSQAHLPWYDDIISKWADWHRTKTTSKESTTKNPTTQKPLSQIKTKTPPTLLPWFEDVKSRRDEWYTRTLPIEDEIISITYSPIFQESLFMTETTSPRVPWFEDVISKRDEWHRTKTIPNEEEIEPEPEIQTTVDSQFSTTAEIPRVPWFEKVISKRDEWHRTKTIPKQELKPKNKLPLSLSPIRTKTPRKNRPWFDKYPDDQIQQWNWKKWYTISTTEKIRELENEPLLHSLTEIPQYNLPLLKKYREEQKQKWDELYLTNFVKNNPEISNKIQQRPQKKWLRPLFPAEMTLLHVKLPWALTYKPDIHEISDYEHKKDDYETSNNQKHRIKLPSDEDDTIHENVLTKKPHIVKPWNRYRQHKNDYLSNLKSKWRWDRYDNTGTTNLDWVTWYRSSTLYNKWAIIDRYHDSPNYVWNGGNWNRKSTIYNEWMEKDNTNDVSNNKIRDRDELSNANLNKRWQDLEQYRSFPSIDWWNSGAKSNTNPVYNTWSRDERYPTISHHKKKHKNKHRSHTTTFPNRWQYKIYKSETQDDLRRSTRHRKKHHTREISNKILTRLPTWLPYPVMPQNQVPWYPQPQWNKINYNNNPEHQEYFNRNWERNPSYYNRQPDLDNTFRAQDSPIDPLTKNPLRAGGYTPPPEWKYSRYEVMERKWAWDLWWFTSTLAPTEVWWKKANVGHGSRIYARQALPIVVNMLWNKYLLPIHPTPYKYYDGYYGISV